MHVRGWPTAGRPRAGTEARTITGDDEKVSTPVRDEPRRDHAGDRDLAGRARRGRSSEQPGAQAVTVEQLVARAGSSVGRRRSARREDPPPVVRNGLPPVPGAPAPDPGEAPTPQAGLPPVPGAASRPKAHPGPPPVPAHERPPAVERQPAAWTPDVPPSRRSGPIPPLPGRMPSGATAATGRKKRERPPRPVRSPRRRLLGRALIALVAIVGVVVLYHLALYFYVDQKIDRVEALATDGPEVLAPQLQEGSETYLVVGTGVPGQEGAASVVTLLASVSAEGDTAALVSFPPTALVDTPTCRTAEGELRNPTTEAFAASLLDGGPSCMVRAVQQLSGLRVDHYLGVDLARLPGLVDALGGVPVCIVPTEATAAAATPPPSGPSELTGSAASGYLQPGESGSDVTGAAVADRAQRMLTSTLRAAMSASTLTSPMALARFLTRAADALTVDEQTNLGDLRVLAGSLGDLSGDAVQRAALPVAQVGYVPAGTDEAYVILDGGGTRTLFDAVIRGRGVPEEFRADGGLAAAEDTAAAEEPTPAPAPEATQVAPGPTVPPGEVAVDVLNGTGTTGLAATVADALRAQGFLVAAVGNESGTVNETVVRHGPNVLEKARTVAAAVPGAVLQASDSIGDAVQLVIGPGYSTVVPVQLSAPVEQPAAASPAPVESAPAPAPVAC